MAERARRRGAAQGRLRLASAIQRRAAQEAARAQRVFIAEVISVKPLRVELLDRDLVLDDDDFDLSQFIRWYDKQFRLRKGDNVLCLDEQGEWVIFDVISDTEVKKL